MIFSDFYKESDRINRHRLKIFGLVFLALFIYIAIAVALWNNQPTQKEIEQIINRSPDWSELDRSCQAIPKPPNFQYKFKKLGGNSLMLSISYWYQSDLPFSKVRDFYISYLEKGGWTLEDLWNEEMTALPRLLRYRKGNRTINVERMATPDLEYAVSCSFDF